MKKLGYFALGISCLIVGVTLYINKDFSNKGNAALQASLETTQQISKLNEDIMKERPIIEFATNKGNITIELFNDLSPNTASKIIKYTKEGVYDNTLFHRVIDNFMIQGGDPNTKDPSKAKLYGTGDAGEKFDDEINDELLVKGSFAMANSGPDTNGSQFFIVTADSTPWLDGAHTNAGKVIGGMDIVEAIGKVETQPNDRPTEDVKIISAKVVKE
ncbi:MAG: peptidylprolyl isomerase [Minisyncoccia bacterium]